MLRLILTAGILLGLVFSGGQAFAQSVKDWPSIGDKETYLKPISPYMGDQVMLSADACKWFLNTDGSCVQCSISMCGVHQNCPQAATLLFDSDFGSKVRGGSYPSRVAAYSEKRKIPIYNITGDETVDWIKWGSRTGRMSAIGFFSSHFQTCLCYYNMDPKDAKPWKIRNNWPGTLDNTQSYSEADFIRQHNASGRWVVILKTPPPPFHPVYVDWPNGKFSP